VAAVVPLVFSVQTMATVEMVTVDDGRKQADLESGLQAATGEKQTDNSDERMSCLRFVMFMGTCQEPRLWVILVICGVLDVALILSHSAIDWIAGFIGGILTILVVAYSYREGNTLMRMDRRIDEMRKSNQIYEEENNKLRMTTTELETNVQDLEGNVKELDSKLDTFTSLQNRLEKWSTDMDVEFDSVIGDLNGIHEKIENANDQLQRNIQKQRDEERAAHEIRTYEHYHTIGWNAQYADDNQGGFTRREWGFLVQKIAPNHVRFFVLALRGHIGEENLKEFNKQFIEGKANPTRLTKIFDWIKEVKKNSNDVLELDTEVVYENLLRKMTGLIADDFMVKMQKERKENQLGL